MRTVGDGFATVAGEGVDPFAGKVKGPDLVVAGHGDIEFAVVQPAGLATKQTQRRVSQPRSNGARISVGLICSRRCDRSGIDQQSDEQREHEVPKAYPRVSPP